MFAFERSVKLPSPDMFAFERSVKQLGSNPGVMSINDNQLPTEHFLARRRFDEEGKLVLELGDTVGQMKRKFGVDKVLAWHAMAGYWAGVEPEAEEMASFEPRVTKLLAPKGIREADPKVRRAPYTAALEQLRSMLTMLWDCAVDGVCTTAVKGLLSVSVDARHELLC